MKELETYLKLHEGSRWNYEQSAFVLAHVAEIERTYRAIIEHEQGVRLRLRESRDQALAKVEAAQ